MKVPVQVYNWPVLDDSSMFSLFAPKKVVEKDFIKLLAKKILALNDLTFKISDSVQDYLDTINARSLVQGSIVATVLRKAFLFELTHANDFWVYIWFLVNYKR